jgi:hypothetical protein
MEDENGGQLKAGRTRVGRSTRAPNPVTVDAGERGCRIFARPPAGLFSNGEAMSKRTKQQIERAIRQLRTIDRGGSGARRADRIKKDNDKSVIRAIDELLEGV